MQLSCLLPEVRSPGEGGRKRVPEMDLGARGGGSSRRFDVDLERRRTLPLLKRHRSLQDAGAGDRHSLGKQPELFLFTHSRESREG